MYIIAIIIVIVTLLGFILLYKNTKVETMENTKESILEMSQKGVVMTNMGFEIIKKANVINKKGHELINYGNDIIKKGEAQVKEGNELVKYYETTMQIDDIYNTKKSYTTKGQKMVENGIKLIKKGEAQLKKGNELLKESNQLNIKGEQISKDGKEMVDKALNIVNSLEAI